MLGRVLPHANLLCAPASPLWCSFLRGTGAVHPGTQWCLQQAGHAQGIFLLFPLVNSHPFSLPGSSSSVPAAEFNSLVVPVPRELQPRTQWGGERLSWGSPGPCWIFLALEALMAVPGSSSWRHLIKALLLRQICQSSVMISFYLQCWQWICLTNFNFRESTDKTPISSAGSLGKPPVGIE